MASLHPEGSELPGALSMEGGTIVPRNILYVNLQLIPSSCPTESRADRACQHEGLYLSCHDGLECRMGDDVCWHCPHSWAAWYCSSWETDKDTP